MSSLPSGIRRVFRLALGRPPIERDVNDEIAFHLEMRVAELVERGWTPQAARAEAMRRFGDTHQWSDAMSAVDRERVVREHRAEWLDDLRQDLRYGVRSLRRAPLFALLAIATLALGIGANAAVFGVVKSVLLDALPYTEADRLVRVYGRFLDGSILQSPLSAGAATDIAERQRSFERISTFMMDGADVVYAGDDAPSVMKAAWVEPDLFQTLGVAPAVGRLFDETVAPDAEGMVVMSHAAWQRLFAGDGSVVDETVSLNGYAHRVVGVLPRGFVGPAGDVDFYIPLDLAPILQEPVRARGENWLGLVGRLAPTATLEGAQRELDGIAADLAREHPGGTAIGLTAMPVRQAMVGDTKKPLLMLMASAALVLLITCANLAGALLSRTISRRGEFAVRVALGAGRGRLVRQLLTESLVLALTGAAVGIGLAMLGLSVLRELALPVLPSYADLALDSGAVAIAFGLALATGLGFGLAPALSVARTNPQGTLRSETRGATESRGSRHLRGVLVAAQIALCVSLVAGAGLLVRSLLTMTAAPLGFTPDGVLTAAVKYTGTAYGPEAARVRFQDQLEERLRSIPGVRTVATGSTVPTTVRNQNGFTIAESPWPHGTSVPFVLYASISDDYFRTLGIPLKQGRTFAPTDRADAPRVVVISEAMAKRYWPAGNAVGSRIRMGPDPQSPLLEVIGIVGDVRNDPARSDAEPMAYGSGRQYPWGSVNVMLRSDGDPLALAQAVRRELAAIDPALPLDRVMTLRAIVADRFTGRQLPVVLMTAFGALALLLASVGVYALFASMVAAREREFGVRIALGSTPGALARLVLKQGAAWMAVGLAVGIAGVAVMARVLRDQLYGVDPFDALTLGTTALVLLVCASIALLVPLRRAVRADPVTALR